MASLIKYLLAAISLTTLESCILSTITEQMETTAEIPTTREPSAQGTLTITLTCTAENLTLLPDSLHLCNILTQDPTSGQLHHTTLSIPTDTATLTLPAQNLRPWNETDMPWETSGSYLKICGKLQTTGTNGSPITICTTPLYHPICAAILPDSTTHIPIILTHSSPLYTIVNDSLVLAIQPITFGAYVEPWKSDL